MTSYIAILHKKFYFFFGFECECSETEKNGQAQRIDVTVPLIRGIQGSNSGELAKNARIFTALKI